MKKIIMKDTVSIDNDMLSIQVSPERQLGSYLEILESMHGQMRAMESYHSRVLVVRLDFHLNEYTDNNKPMTEFFQKLRKRMKKQYPEHTRMGYIWVREKERAKQQHYHVGLLLNANVIRHPAKFIELCEAIWQEMNHPKPYTPENAYYTIKRDDYTSFAEAFYRLSYLAKVRGKKYRPATVNDYSASRIKRKNPNN